MFKVKRFRNLVMKYKTIYSDKPELVKQNADYYISNLHNLIGPSISTIPPFSLF